MHPDEGAAVGLRVAVDALPVAVGHVLDPRLKLPARREALLAASIATGAAVATAGAIGFVGLVVPHALRLAGVRGAAALLPASALAGGAFVVLADAIARSAFAPLQLPVGVLSAAVGVPVFVALLLRGSRR